MLALYMRALHIHIYDPYVEMKISNDGQSKLSAIPKFAKLPPTNGEGYVFISVGLSVSLFGCVFVCLWTTLWKNESTDFHEIFRIGLA